MNYHRFRLDCFDQDQLKDALEGTEVEHTLLPEGPLYFEHEKLSLDSSVLQSGSYGKAILVEGSFPKQRFSIGFLLAGHQSARTIGHTIDRHSIQLYAENAAIRYRAAPETTWVVLTVDCEVLQESALRLTGRPLPIPRSGCLSVDPPPEVGRRIANRIRQCFAAGAQATGSKQAMALGTALEEQLIHDFALGIQGSQLDSRGSRVARNQARRRHIVGRAEEYLRANLNGPFSLAGLAASTDTSARMVEYYFRDIYGMTPLQWFRCKKLKMVRDELARRERRDTRVTDVAMDWGFSHLGRFSREYRRLFGEKPSDTLCS